jgi:PAS domain-containing protein
MFGERTGMEKDSGFLSVIFDNIRENIVVVDAENYEILHANQSFLDSFGIPLEESRKKRCYEVTHRNDKPRSGKYVPPRSTPPAARGKSRSSSTPMVSADAAGSRISRRRS